MRPPSSFSLTLSVLAAGAQQQPSTQPTIDTPIFRSTVDAIELDAFVVDADGNPVTDLDADDFEIFADGKLQELTAFAAVNIPIERIERAAAAIAPDVRTNEHREGRIYLFAIDEIPGNLAPGCGFASVNSSSSTSAQPTPRRSSTSVARSGRPGLYQRQSRPPPLDRAGERWIRGR